MALIGVLTVFVVIVAVKEIKAIGYVGANPNQSNTINVSGTGEAVAIPDIATFSFSVTETAKTVAEAQTAATAKINAAIAALSQAGIEDRDIKTQGYNINPHYEYQNAVCPARTPTTISPDGVGMPSSVYYCPPGKSVLTGYDVSQTIGVKIRDLEKAGAIFTSIGALEVDSVNGLNFSVDKPEDIQAKARAEAIAEAEAKAKELAKQLGVRLVRIISFSENGNYPYARAYGMGGDASVKLESAAAAPQVPVGEQEVSSTVNITYEIK